MKKLICLIAVATLLVNPIFAGGKLIVTPKSTVADTTIKLKKTKTGVVKKKIKMKKDTTKKM